MGGLIAPSINLALLIGILVYKLKTPMCTFVFERAEHFKKELDAVRKETIIAQEQYDSYTAQLKAVQVELAFLREESKNEMLILKQKMQMQSQKNANQLVSNAKNKVEQLYSELKNQIVCDLGLQIMDQVEAGLKSKMTFEDKTRIQKETLKQMGCV